MKQVAIGVAILVFVVLTAFAYKNHVAAVEAAARIADLEKSQAEQLASVKSEVAALSKSIDRVAASIANAVAASRDASLRGLDGVEGRVQRSLAAVQGRLAEVSDEQVRLSGRLEAELAADQPPALPQAAPMAPAATEPEATPPAPQARSLEAAASLLVSAPTAEPAIPRPPQRASPALDLPMQRAMQQGTAFYETGRYADARERFAAVLEKQPENDEARRMHAFSLYLENPADSSSYGRIEADLQAFARGGDADPEALRVLGLVAMEQARWSEARDRFAQAIALEPGNPKDAKNAGLCSLRLGDATAARRALDAACALAPADAESWHYAGMACLESGDKDAALARFRRCLEIEGGFVAARVRAGTLLAELGRTSDALETLAPVRRLADAAAAIGDCHEQLGDAGSARSAWLEAIGLIRENSAADRRRVASLYAKLAGSALKSGAPALCIDYCRQGLARDAEAAMLRALLGAGQVALGEVDEGRRLLQEIADAYPGSDAGTLAAASLAGASSIGRP